MSFRAGGVTHLLEPRRDALCVEKVGAGQPRGNLSFLVLAATHRAFCVLLNLRRAQLKLLQPLEHGIRSRWWPMLCDQCTHPPARHKTDYHLHPQTRLVRRVIAPPYLIGVVHHELINDILHVPKCIVACSRATTIATAARRAPTRVCQNLLKHWVSDEAARLHTCSIRHCCTGCPSH